MYISVKEILAPLNISDGGCESKLARFNDILASFTAEVYDLYPMKRMELYPVNSCTTTIRTKYPIAKVWGFFGKGCSVGCSLKPEDCCAGHRRLLMSEYYVDELDRNSYNIYYNKFPGNDLDDCAEEQIEAGENDRIVQLKLPSGTTSVIIVYSRGWQKVTSLNDKIEIDPYMLSLLRTYIRSEYALESENDINMAANYYSRFQSRYKILKSMYDNMVKFVVPGGLSENGM